MGDARRRKERDPNFGKVPQMTPQEERLAAELLKQKQVFCDKAWKNYGQVGRGLVLLAQLDGQHVCAYVPVNSRNFDQLIEPFGPDMALALKAAADAYDPEYEFLLAIMSPESELKISCIPASATAGELYGATKDGRFGIHNGLLKRAGVV